MPSNKTAAFLTALLVVIVGFLSVVVHVYAASKERVLHSFGTCKKDGTSPGGSLIFDAAGHLYGTTGGGGTGQCKDINGNFIGCGTVFELLHDANGKWTEKVLHSFNFKDGAYPLAGLIFDASGNLYGATVGGGNDSLCDGGYGCGTAFELIRGAKGKWTEKVLHSFGPLPDGFWPEGSLVSDAAGNLYGTTTYGGNTYYATGTVFELRPDSHGEWKETILYNFGNYEEPMANLIFDANGNLYSTAYMGGAYDYGMVFELTGGKWTLQGLHSFNGSDGAYPTAGLTPDSKGNLYGTTTEHGGGLVFKLTRCGSGKWTEKVLYYFCSKIGCADGSYPSAGVILDTAGAVYGTTYGGGDHGVGVVFRLTAGSDGKWTETVLHSFKDRDGAQPYAGLVMDGAGNLYGTTEGGGSYGKGIVFEVTP